MRPAILFHEGCSDGMGAALAAYLVYGSDADYYPATHGAPMPQVEAGRPILMLDFSYKRDVLIDLSLTNEIIIIDHHASAQADLAGIEARSNRISCIFDMTKSGAVLAWEFFHASQPVPPLLQYIQDRDLWTWALPESRAINEAIYSYPQTFPVWVALLTKPLNDLAREGAALLRAQQKNVEALCREVRGVFIGAHIVPVVNAPYFFSSDVGHALLAKYPDAPYAASYYHTAEGDLRWSLRSENTRVDVGAIAVEQGGGGHRNAAGFTSPGHGRHLLFTFQQSYEDAIVEWHRLLDRHQGNVDAAVQAGCAMK